MNHQQLIKLIDLLSFLGLLAMIVTGVLIEYSLPPRSGGSEIWGLTRHQWGEIHFYSSLAFVSLISAHLLIHLKYIKAIILGKASREHKYRIAIGLAGLIALLLLLFALFTAPVESNTSRQGWQHQRN